MEEELARLEALASMVSDSSESEESGNDSDTDIVKDVAEEIIDTKTEELDISENITAPDCMEDDNSYDASNDTSASTVSVPRPAGGLSSERILMLDSQMEKVAPMPSMASLQDILNSIESTHDLKPQPMEETSVEGEEEVEEQANILTKDTAGEYNHLRVENTEGELFFDYPMEMISNAESHLLLRGRRGMY